MTRKPNALTMALLAGTAVALVPMGADAFSGFKGRYQQQCPKIEVTACPSSPTSAPPGRPVTGHVLKKSTHNTVIEIQEGYSRTLRAICKSGEWQIARRGYCGDWDLNVGSWGSCNASCGGGSQSRNVNLTCRQPGNGGPDNAGVAPDAACDGASRPTEPIASRSCNTQACAPPARDGGPGGAGSSGDSRGEPDANGPGNDGKGVGGVGGGGSGGGSCFAPDTPVRLADGRRKPIADVRIGDRLESGARVTATGRFLTDDLYILDGIRVSGAHAVYRNGRWQRVRDLPDALRVLGQDHLVINLASEDHIIPAGDGVFADYFEIGGAFAQEAWMELIDALGGADASTARVAA